MTPITVRYNPDSYLTEDQWPLALEVEAARWRPFGDIIDQHHDSEGATTVVQPRTDGGATALAAAIKATHAHIRVSTVTGGA